jgi:hypothetical protein
MNHDSFDTFDVVDAFWDVSLRLEVSGSEDDDDMTLLATSVTLKEPTIFDVESQEYIGGRELRMTNESLLNLDDREDSELDIILDMFTKTFNQVVNSNAINVSFDTIRYAQLMEDVKLRDKERFE